MACKYTFGELKDVTYKQLVDSVYKAYSEGSMKLLKEVNDVLFSVSDDPGAEQKRVIDKVRGMNESYRYSTEFIIDGTPTLDGNPKLKGSDNVITPQDFFNSEEFNPGGEKNDFVMDTEQYKKIKYEKYIGLDISEEDAMRLVQEDVDNWSVSSENARVFHHMMMKNNDRTSSATWNADKSGTAFGRIENMAGIQEKVYGSVRKRNPKNKLDATALYPEIIKNVNFSAKMDNGKTMIGHLDYLCVREDGSLDMYLIKTSADPLEWWSDVKKENYRYEMSFLKQMLANNGLDTSNARMNIIPVRFEYAVDPETGRRRYNEVKSVDVQRVYSLDTAGGYDASIKYDNVASSYISSSFDASKIRVDFFPEVDRILKVAFNESDIKSEGIRKSASDWVRDNWGRCVVKKKPEGGYKINLIGTNLSGMGVVDVSDPHRGADNKEFVEKVEQFLSNNLNSGYNQRVGKLIKQDFIDSFKRYGFFKTDVRGVDAYYLRNRFRKYFIDLERNKDEEGNVTFKSNWSIIDSPALEMANIIAIRHKSGVIDFIAFSEMDLDQVHRFYPGHDNLLGAHISDTNDENFNLLSDYGNIELMRNCAIINYLVPKLGGNNKLGSLSIISTAHNSARKGMSVSLRNVSKYWNTFVKVVNRASGGEAGIVNNLGNGSIGFMSEEGELIREYMGILSTEHGSGVDLTAVKDLRDVLETHTGPDGRPVYGLIDSKTIASKKLVIREFMRRVKILLGGNGRGVYVSDTKNLVRLANQPDYTETNILARLYIQASKLMNIYEGDVNLQNQDLNWMQMNFIKTTSSKNDIARRNGEIVQSGIDAVRDRMADDYYGRVKMIFDKLYKDASYSKLRNTLLGDQTVVYKNMFERNADGENLFIFKNPYDRSSDLKDYERSFLKDILFEFYKVRCRMKHETAVVSGTEDSRLYNDMPEDYLVVPLQKASVVSRRSNVKNMVKRLGDSLHRIITDLPGTVEERINWLKDDTHKRQVDRAMKNMQTINPYSRTEGDINARNIFLSEKGRDFFETDVENIFIDYLFAQTRCEEMDNLLFRTNAIELALRLRGIDEYNDESAEQINKTVDYVNKYLRVNVYQGSIMEKAGDILEKSMKGLRKVTTEILLGTAPANWMRDQIQMFSNNFASAIIKYRTDLKFNNLKNAYMYVWLDCLKSIKGMSILEQLNNRYGISSFDSSNVATKLKTQGGALLDEQRWIYWSMKNPDYINRMVLFVARAKQDGSWDAYGLDEHGTAKYNWRKDKRFNLLAKGEAGRRENSAEYNKQWGRYCDMIDQFNRERPERNLTYQDDLPDAYTAKEIKAVKSLAENLYGAYDRSSKAMLENMALGRNFAWFITWFNGIADTYVGPNRIDTSSVKWKQMTNEDGKPLYRNTETGELTTEVTDLPAYEQDNTMATSVFRELRSMFQMLRGNGMNVRDYYDRNVRDNPEVKQLYRKLCLDMSVTAMFSLLFGLLVKPAYKQFKSVADGERFFQNVCVELLYRGWSRAFDVFSGPMVMLKYFGDSTNPVYYDMGSKMITDMFNVVTGKKAFGSTMLSYSALYRNMQDSYKMWVKTHRDQLDIE